MPFEELHAVWNARLVDIFGGNIPERAEWYGPQIVPVLNAVSGSFNHVFFPDGGGLDLLGCRFSNEGLLEWATSDSGFDTFVHVCSPVRLLFWNPGPTSREANFILEVSGLPPVDPDHRGAPGAAEEVVELSPGRYIPRYAWDQGEYQGQRLPQTARLLVRVTQAGRFAIFGKGALYNQFRGGGFDAYNAHHNDPSEFKRIVEQLSQMPD